MNTKILPFNSCISYNHTPMIVDLLGILYANNIDSAEAWVYNINFSMCLGDNYYDLSLHNRGICWLMPGQPYKVCELIDYYMFPFDYVEFQYSSFIEFIKNLIDLGYYILVDLDYYYIENSYWYNKDHYPHDMLITGYEYDNVVCFDYFQYKFEKKMIRNFTINEAFKGRIEFNLIDYIGGILCIKPRNNCVYKFKNDLYVNKLKDYLIGNISIDYASLDIYHFEKIYKLDYRKDISYGIKCYQAYIKYIEECAKNHIIPNNMPASMIFQHNMIYYDTIVYMHDKLGLCIPDRLLNISKELYYNSKIILNKNIKLFNKQNDEAYISLIRSIEKLEKTDIDLSSQLINQLNEVCLN